MTEYRKINPNELSRELFAGFQRKQIVTDCFRKEDGKWTVKSDPFIDDWTEADYEELVRCLKNTAETGGLVYGAFAEGRLKGFVSVEGTLIGSRRQYADLSSIHVSLELRGQGIGRKLFLAAKRFAKGLNAEKLYISAHSAVESQAFYRAMGCVEAEEYDPLHTQSEPFDCQLECELN